MNYTQAADIMMRTTETESWDSYRYIQGLPSVQGFSVGRNYHCLLKCSKDVTPYAGWSTQVGNVNNSSGGLLYFYSYYSLFFEFYHNSISAPLWISPYFLKDLYEYEAWNSWDTFIGKRDIGCAPTDKMEVKGYSFSLTKRIGSYSDKFNTFYTDITLHRTVENTKWTYYEDGKEEKTSAINSADFSFTIAKPWVMGRIILGVSESVYESYLVDQIKDVWRYE